MDLSSQQRQGGQSLVPTKRKRLKTLDNDDSMTGKTSRKTMNLPEEQGHMYRPISLLVLLLLLSGCFGGVVVFPVECDFDYPIKNYTYTKNEFGPCEGAEAIYLNKNDFLMFWGKPDEIVTLSESKETWIYKKKESCGVVPMWLVAVPLTFSACDVLDEILFENDLAIHVHFKRMVTTGLAIGATETGPWMAKGATPCPENKTPIDTEEKPPPPTDN